MSLSTNKRIALAYLLGKLAGRREEYDDESDDEPEERPRKRPNTNSAPNRGPKRQRLTQDGDEYHHFAQSLALQLRKLPQIEAMRMMQQMQTMVVNKKIQLENKTNRKMDRLADVNSEPYIEISQEIDEAEGLRIDFYGDAVPLEDPIGSKLECSMIKEEP